MDVFKIEGGVPLSGTINLQGAKNAVLPILSATVLNQGKSIIHNCPDLSDVKMCIEILKILGCDARFENGTVFVDSSNIKNNFIPKDMMCKMRSSIIFTGAIISRMRSAIVSHPGGCELGGRPIDLHIDAFKKLGAEVSESEEFIYFSAPKIKPNVISLPFPSVGATENIMLLTAVSEGVTTILNAAKEPEIVDLAKYLNSAGARIFGAGSEIIEIIGVKKLHDTEHKIIPDRIAASTYLMATAATGGIIEIKGFEKNHCGAVLDILKEQGAGIYMSKNRVVLTAPKKIRAVDMIKTSPYPGFPTDAQSIAMSMLAVSDGVSVIKENVFNDRFKHALELNKMGADIKVMDKIAIVNGVKKLSGKKVESMDLRSGAGLVLAGLVAQGETTVTKIDRIERGYENFPQNLKKLGANIQKISQ